MDPNNGLQIIQTTEQEFLVTQSNFSFKILHFDRDERRATETAKIAIPEFDSFW